MDIEEGKALVQRVMAVILSCKTEDQLMNAYKYVKLAHKKMYNGIGHEGFVKEIHNFTAIERSIGFAQCQIKYGVDV